MIGTSRAEQSPIKMGSAVKHHVPLLLRGCILIDELEHTVFSDLHDSGHIVSVHPHRNLASSSVAIVWTSSCPLVLHDRRSADTLL